MYLRSRQLFALTAIVAALSVSPAISQNATGLDRRPAQVTRGEPGRPLFAMPGAAPSDITAGYLRSRGRSDAMLATLRTKRSDVAANGVTHLRLEQEVDGLAVHGAYVKAAVNARGELVHVVDRLAPVTALKPNRIDALVALQAAMTQVHPAQAVNFRRGGVQGNVITFDGGPFFHSAPAVTAVAIPMDDGSLARGWLVETWTAQKNLLHYTLVDGDGRVLQIEKRTANDSYNVFIEDPLKGGQTVVSGPAPGGVPSPAGWLDSGKQSTINIAGNNVNAYLDAKANNQPDPGGTRVSDGNFLTAADLRASPTTVGNQAVSVQNLFYLNNVVHDVLYGHGFTEAAGNFQADNFGRGGTGKDPVQAEAQDGGGTDNANFATPPDGHKPRMQMFLWTGNGATHEVQVNSPVARSYVAAGAEFGPVLTPTGVTGDVVAAVPADGCAAISTPLAGKIALIDRGACDFSLKALNAQTAGAAAVIIANNQGGTAVFTMGAGADAKKVRIPAVMISQNDGAELKGLTAPNATARKLAVQPIQIDGSVDADIVFHEYGHGLTWRMIGGMSGPLAGAIGEGASDGIAMLINGDDTIAEYSTSNPIGIRRNRYSGYPRTYKAVTGAEVHDDGEIYAAIVWRMIELFGDRRAVLFRYVVDGMNFTPATPAYEQMRDGILASVANGPAPADCVPVWQAFAQFGVGVGALGVVTSTGVQITESFTALTPCN